MRIAVFSYYLPHETLRRGGIERIAHEIANGLCNKGHNVVVFSYDQRPNGASYQVLPLPGKKLASHYLGQRILMGYLGNLLFLFTQLKAFDAVLTHGDSLLLPFCGKPVFRVFHGSAAGEALSARSLLRFLGQIGVYVIEVLSAFSGATNIAVSHNSRRFQPRIPHVVPNGIDLTQFKPSGKKTEHPSILFVGTLSGRKRGAFLLKLFQEYIRPRLPECECVMVSPPGNAIPGVTYRTGISQEELIRLYQRSWLFVSPSSYEGFGLPLVEAMACGTAVVASPNAGSREVLAEGQFGKICDDATLARTILRLLGDESERKPMETLGLSRAADYSADKMCDSYEEILCGRIGNIVKVF